MKIIHFTITNDISYDQRMHRICKTLAKAGYEVCLIGRNKKDSIPLKNEIYTQKRLTCFFEKGKLFYLEYNLRLFLYLMHQKTDIICAIDLDTLLPCFMVSKMRSKEIVFDAHEHFTEVIEVVNRPVTKWIWLKLEKTILPKLTYAYTVSENLREIFTKKYGVPFQLIRNLSELEEFPEEVKKEKYFIYAGAVNEGRGLRECITAMQFIPAKFYICGKGDLFEELVLLAKELKLEEKVIFLGYVTPDLLKQYIRKSFVGCLLLENKGLSYYYSLANKFFDYMHAGIPQITINFPEYVFLNEKLHIAELIPLEVKAFVDAATKLIEDETHYQQLANNAKSARLEYNWQKESEKLIQFYKEIL